MTFKDFGLAPPEGFSVVPGYPNHAAHRDGRIVSCQGSRGREWRSLFGKSVPKGYVKIMMVGPNGYLQTYAHRIILLTFVGPPPEGKNDSCHNDGNPGNNSLKNLRWDSRKGNLADRVAHGTLAYRPGSSTRFPPNFTDYCL